MNKKYHKQNDSCRKCGHFFEAHCIYIRVEQGGLSQPFIYPLDVVPCNSGTDPVYSNAKPCGCLNWEPQDNLEYLELLAEKQDQKNV